MSFFGAGSDYCYAGKRSASAACPMIAACNAVATTVPLQCSRIRDRLRRAASRLAHRSSCVFRISPARAADEEGMPWRNQQVPAQQVFAKRPCQKADRQQMRIGGEEASAIAPMPDPFDGKKGAGSGADDIADREHFDRRLPASVAMASPATKAAPSPGSPWAVGAAVTESGRNSVPIATPFTITENRSRPKTAVCVNSPVER